MKISDFLKLITAILVSQAAGVIGSFFTVSAISNWYDQLVKPTLIPPGWVFAPAWITLYTLMGISLFLVWKSYGSNKKRMAVIIFFIQLFLNALWSILFFGMENPLLGLINIFILLGVIILTIIIFYQISKKAAYLLIPYLVWVGFAAYLNYAIWVLN